MAPVLLPLCVIVFGDKQTQGSLKAFAADGLSLGPLLRIWVFLVFLTVGFFFGFFGRCFLLVAGFMYILL